MIYSGVLQGSSVCDTLRSTALTSNLVENIINTLVGVANIVPGLWNFQLTHWGLQFAEKETFDEFKDRMLKSPWAQSESNGFYDLAIACKSLSYIYYYVSCMY